MKNISILYFLLATAATLSAQDLQVHYDPRHTLDPSHNTRNFPTLYFQYLKNQDSGKAFIKPGSFLLKVQTDLQGASNNIGQTYIQLSQTFRAWKPPVFLNLQYSGGLGVTEPKQYSYYISNTYYLGLAYTFQWKGAWLSAVLNYKCTSYPKPSNDPSFTFYWWRGYFHYKLEFAGDFSVWTEDKRFFFFAEPQLWYNINKLVSLGTKVNMYYHVITPDAVLQAYPTAAIRFKL